MFTDQIMWPPASKIRYQDDTDNFFSIAAVYIVINRGQFLIPFFLIVHGFKQMGGMASYSILTLYPPSVFVKLGLKSINLQNMLI
jgi:hypothetical protein